METEMNNEKIYDKKFIILEAQHDPTTFSGGSSSFTIDLNNGGFGELRDVIGLKLHSMYIVPRDGSPNAYNGTIYNASVYIALNDYANIITGVSTLPPVFAHQFCYAAPDALKFQSTDNDVYMFDPIVPRLSKFKVRLLTKSGEAFNTQNNNVIIKLIAYMKRNKPIQMPISQ